MPLRFVTPIRVGIVLGAATTAAYLIGSGRSFGYDAAATFANFVATPNLVDAFAVHAALPSILLKSIASNDHVFLSLISHAIYSLTAGSRSEAIYRLVPALAAGGTVGVSAAVLSRRFGLIAGACAGLFIATDPLFVDNSRDLRGYSLAALLTLLSTVVLVRPLSPQGRGLGRGASLATWTRGRLLAYAILLGLAIATHVFAIVVLLGDRRGGQREHRGHGVRPAWLPAEPVRPHFPS